MAIIISCFPLCGRTTYAQNSQYKVLDLDTNPYMWVFHDSTEVRNPDFPNNYIEAINDNANKYDIILVPSSITVRFALSTNNIPYYLVYPDNSQACYNEWKRRAELKGSHYGVSFLFDSLWKRSLVSCRDDKNAVLHIKLDHDSYLSSQLHIILKYVGLL